MITVIDSVWKLIYGMKVVSEISKPKTDPKKARRVPKKNALTIMQLFKITCLLFNYYSAARVAVWKRSRISERACEYKPGVWITPGDTASVVQRHVNENSSVSGCNTAIRHGYDRDAARLGGDLQRDGVDGGISVKVEILEADPFEQ